MSFERYLLETNVLSHLITHPQGKASARIGKVGESNICASIIVAAELHMGVQRVGSRRLLEAVEEVLAEIEVLPLDLRWALPSICEAAAKSQPGTARTWLASCPPVEEPS
jgi:predicted nucleic acid-binding protein